MASVTPGLAPEAGSQEHPRRAAVDSGADSAKATIMGRVRNAQHGMLGYSQFDAGREQAYFEQLPGEALVTTRSKGRPILEGRPKKGLRHASPDARVYAHAAPPAHVSMGLVRDPETDRIAAQDGPVPDKRLAAARVTQSRWMNTNVWGPMSGYNLP